MQFRIPYLLTLLAVLLLPISSIAGSGSTIKPKMEPTLNQPDYIRMADNFFVFYDPSTAMNVPYKGTGMTRLEVEKQILQESNASLPELGWQAGLYPHWKNVMWLPGSPETFHPYYRLQNYDNEKYGAAIKELPVISTGPPMLQIALMKLEYLLGLSGRTEVFLFSNGEDSRVKGVEEPEPLAQAKKLAANYHVCFTIISSATSDAAAKLLNDIASVNSCSQVIDFDTVADNPEHLFGKLYMKTDGAFENVLFDFDKFTIKKQYKNTLNKLGRFLIDHPQTYTVLSGFTDNRGTEAYNILLSKRRAEGVRKYLRNTFKISPDRMLLYWYGYADPIATNFSKKGRKLNRRVTITIRDKKNRRP